MVKTRLNLIFLFIILVFLRESISKEVLNEDKLKEFLKEGNPYVEAIIREVDVYTGKARYYTGSFNPKVGSKLENKEYYKSSANYRSYYLDFPLFFGADLSVGFLKAEGTQDYNNLKTSDKGRYFVDFRVPLTSIIGGIDHRRLNYINSLIEVSRKEFEVNYKLNKLYSDVLEVYYKTLYYFQVLQIEKELLQKAVEREKIISRRVEEGALANITLIEARQQVLNRKQRVIKAENDYNNSLNELLGYIGISRQQFQQQFELPQIQDPVTDIKLDQELYYQQALKNSPKLAALDRIKQELKNHLRLIEIQRFPEVDLIGNINRDLGYSDTGYKVGLDISFLPINDKYIGKKIEVGAMYTIVQNEEQREKIELGVTITNLINSINTAIQNYEIALNDTQLAKQLEQAEVRRFEMGLSNLLLVNLREIATIDSVKNIIFYKVDFWKNYAKLRITVFPQSSGLIYSRN